MKKKLAAMFVCHLVLAQLGLPQVVLSGGVTTSGQVAINNVLFANGFEEGNFSKWYGTQAFGCNVTRPASQPEVNTTAKHSGTYGMSSHYNIAASPTCATSTDQDEFVEATFAATREVYIRAYYYWKTPEAGLWPNDYQTKLMRPLDDTNYTNATWGVSLTADCDPTTANCGVRIASDKSSPFTPWSLYGGMGDQASESPGVFNGIFEFNRDRWYCVELHLKAKSAAGATDSVVELWVDNNLEFSKSSGWEEPHCKGNVAYGPCAPFPGDGENQGLRYVRLGEQLNRVDGEATEMFYYLDDVVISLHRIGC